MQTDHTVTPDKMTLDDDAREAWEVVIRLRLLDAKSPELAAALRALITHLAHLARA